MSVWRSTRFVGVLGCVTVLGAIAAGAAAPAQAAIRAAAVRGVSVEIVQVPDEFVAGARPVTLTVVASNYSGRNCLKVRWSMVLRVEGLSLEQVRVDRIEEGSFPVDVRAEGPGARFTDERLDPGSLCRNRTVTARYEMNVASDVRAGRLTLRTEAYDANERLLEDDEATRDIVGAGPPPTTAPAARPSATVPAAAPATAAGSAAAPGQAAGQTVEGIPVIWFLVGGLMVFVGLTLLINVRWRQEGPADDPGGGFEVRRAARRTVRYAAARRPRRIR
jgi:hypothetical protein